MTHSLIIEEVLAHPQDISWLTRRTLAGCRGRYNISFLLALPPAPHCLPVIFTGGKKTPQQKKIGHY